MSYVIVAIMFFAIGAVGMLFFINKNPKYLAIASMGKEKLAELKKKIEEII